MNRDKIVDLFNGTTDEFVVDAIESRSAVPNGQIQTKHIYLIAAVIAAVLVLAGCVAVFNWLNSRSIAKESYTWSFDEQGRYKEPEARKQQILTFYGDEKSPLQKAMREWYAFEKTYDPDGKLIPKNGVDVGIQRRYETVYACYTQEMADNIDEIARKFGLKLLKDWVPYQSYQVDVAMEGAGVSSILRSDANVRISNMAGMLFPPYNLDAEFTMKLIGEDAAWTKDVIIEYRYAHKDYLPGYGFYAWDGVEDLLVFWDDGDAFEGYTYRYGSICRVSSGSAVCQNNVIEQIQETISDRYEEGLIYQYHKSSGHTLQTLAMISYNRATDKWTDELNNIPITEAEAKAMMDKYPRIELELHPIEELLNA